jgi:hypothetical protein
MSSWGVYWTLFVEVRLYLLFAVVVQVGVTYRRVVLFCAVWMTVAVLATVLQSPLMDIIAQPGCAPYFIAGIAMYLMWWFRPNALLVAITGFARPVAVQRVGERLQHLTRPPPADRPEGAAPDCSGCCTPRPRSAKTIRRRVQPWGRGRRHRCRTGRQGPGDERERR